MAARTPAWHLTEPSLPIAASAIKALSSAEEFRKVLLEQIASAKKRIVLVALYLQDDSAGREVLEALYAAHKARPHLKIRVLVDWHRAQRGLIGHAKSDGNAARYRELAERFGPGVEILGIPVSTREVFGVLHLKGFVFDDTVLYSGASLNDVYLAKHGRFRRDRYHLLHSAALATSFCNYVEGLTTCTAVRSLTSPKGPKPRGQGAAIRALRKHLRSARYEIASTRSSGHQVTVTPLVGFGATKNPLNDALLGLVNSTQRKLVLYTPYFNLPKDLARSLARLLEQGRDVTIVVGDKTANDFFIPPTEKFKPIGLLPYLYENSLRRFVRRQEAAIAAGHLNVYLWRDGTNSFHLKGLFIDERWCVLTGNNLNPRSWAMDLENALVIDDPNHSLAAMHAAEQANILKHATRLSGTADLERVNQYPPQVQQALRPVVGLRLDKLVNRVM